MSWHNNAVLVRVGFADQRECLRLIGMGNAVRRPDLDRTLDGHFTIDLGLAVRNGWTCMFGPVLLDVIDRHRLALLAECGDVLAWALEGTCGYGRYQWWSRGALLREWGEMEHEVLIDRGEPLFNGDELTPAEIDTEERVFKAMAALAMPIEQLYPEVIFAAYEIPRGRIRDWLRRWIRI